MYSKLGIKLTNEQFDDKIKGSGFKRITDYVNTKTTIEFKCKNCGKIFKKKPKEFSKLKCSCYDRSSEYDKILSEKQLSILDRYYNIRTKLRHKCLKCNNTFVSSPKTVRNAKYGCPYCAGKYISDKDYKRKLPNNIEAIGEYINSYSKLKHKCKDCDNIWETKPNYILHMFCGCPFCSSSKGEKLITNILKKLNFEFSAEFMVNIDNNKYYYDFFLPELNIFIEYDGIQHFEPIDYFGGITQFENIKKSDLIKDQWCVENNYFLLRLPYYRYDEVEYIIIDYISYVLNI